MQNNLNNNEVDKVIELDEKQQAEEAARIEELRGAVNQLFKSKNGIILGKWLYEQCNSGKFNNDLNPHIMAFYKGKEKVYQDLRQFMSKENIINIELGGYE